MIWIGILIIAFCAAFVVSSIDNRQLKKEFDSRLKAEQACRYRLEERHMKLYQDYTEHFKKYHR